MHNRIMSTVEANCPTRIIHAHSGLSTNLGGTGLDLTVATLFINVAITFFLLAVLEKASDAENEDGIDALQDVNESPL